MDTPQKTLDLLAPSGLPSDANVAAIRLCQDRLKDALTRLERLVPPETADRVAQLRREVENFAVRVSMVGQVKAGKTALSNALIGHPGLLPSDVNPWTSVITSVHMNTAQPKGKDAVFTFFTREEWAKMVDVGGHLGEMALRANFDEELEELRDQIAAMQQRTEARLGHNFGLLLDGYHSFLGASPEMVARYVCLGDDDHEKEGRYADVTKSADLYITKPDEPLPTVLCDTPGVNDPFLLREAVTLENLTDTDICVVVLSAHQAFSTVDIALLRILMALKHEQLVLFVNRIDELQDPEHQIEEIDSYIRGMLAEQNLPTDLPIVFGSATWAEGAVSEQTTELFANSAQSLFDFSTARQNRLRDVKNIGSQGAALGSAQHTLAKTTDLSGLHELQSILREKAAVNVGRPFLDRIRAEALDVSEQSQLYLDEVSNSQSAIRSDLDFDAFFDELDTVLLESSDACTRIAEEMSQEVLLLMSSAFRQFLSRETSSLRNHLQSKRKIADWKPDSDRLRRELNLAHDKFVDHAPARVRKILDSIANQVEVIYAMVLNHEDDIFAVRAPKTIEPKTPVSLMRSMAVDMNAGWFSSWFNTRFNHETYVKKFEEICIAEMQTTLKDMEDTYVVSYEKQIRAQLYVFLNEHIQTLQKLCGLGRETYRAETQRQLGVDTEIRGRQAELQTVITDLENLFKRPKKTELPIDKSVA